MSAYSNDDRVVVHEDGTATIPDPGSDQGDWRVERGQNGGFVLGNDDHYVTDPGDWYNTRRQVWDTAEEAIAFVVGAPR